MAKMLLFLICSAMLFSCNNENNRDVSTSDENVETREDKQDATKEQASIKDTIEVYQPKPGEVVSSPLKIEGRARGTWYFEGSFAVKLLDENENEIAVVPAEAQDSWMTEDWVDFEATLEFKSPDSEEGYLVLEKANPSGLEEHARELRIKVEFKSP